MSKMMLSGALLLLASVAGSASARTALSATRVIVAAEEGEASVLVYNRDPQPALIQAWIDDGRAELAPEVFASPFQILPHVTRIEGNDSAVLRIVVVQPEVLPTDRERLYWLNVVEIPRKVQDGDVQTDAEQSAELHVQIRSRVKLIHRPAGLNGSAADAVAALAWTWTDDARTLTVSNPSPWIVNLNQVNAGGHQVDDLDNGSVLPFATRTMHFANPVPTAEQTVHFEWVNDWGGLSEETANSHRASAN